MGPRKYKSGAQKRRARREKEAKRDVIVRWAAVNTADALRTKSAKQYDPNGPPVELPIWGVPPPTLVAAVNAAISSLEQGQFSAPAMLCDGMTRDDRVRAMLWQRIDRLTGSEMELDPAKDTARARNIAEDCEDQFTDILPPHEVSRLLRNGLMMGVGIAQVIRERTEDAVYPSITVWNNRYLRYDQTVREYFMVTENRGDLMLQKGDPEWVIYEPFGPHGWMDSAIMRCIALPWLIRYWCLTWWARHEEAHGSPIRLGIIPAQRDPADEKLFLKQLSTFGHEAAIRLPQGTDGNRFDVKLLEAASNGWDGFQKLLEYCDDAIAISFLGQTQSTKGQGGLGTQENAGESTLLRLTRSDSLIYVDLRKQVLKPWTDENYGDADMAPYPCPQIEPPADESLIAKTDLTIGQALQSFKSSGAPIDPRAYLQSRGYGELLMSEQEHAAAKVEAVEQAQQAMAGMRGQLAAPGEDTASDNEPGEESEAEPTDGNDGELDTKR